MTQQEQERLDVIFRALADPTRRTILEELALCEEQSLFEICVRLIEDHGLSLSRQAISKHLGLLEDAGLLQTSWKGRTKIHSSNLEPNAKYVQSWVTQNAKK